MLEVGRLLGHLGFEVELIDSLYPQDAGMPEFEHARSDTRVDFAQEPMFKNNSPLPLRSRSFNREVVNYLKNLVSNA